MSHQSILCGLLFALSAVHAQSARNAPQEITPAERVLLIQNDKSAASKEIVKYYAAQRGVPESNICHIHSTTDEEVYRDAYDEDIAKPIAKCLKKNGLLRKIYYIVTTSDVPLKITGPINKGVDAEYASVDSELTVLFQDITGGKPHRLAGVVPNPFFGHRDQPFSLELFPVYLVTRLAAYDVPAVKGMIDRCMQAKNRGKFVFDLSDAYDGPGNDWLRNAAILIPKDRVIVDMTDAPVYDQSDVIGYASWGSNDKHRDRRFTGSHFLPGAIVTEYVSSDARSFKRPPEKWIPGRNWQGPGVFQGSPQSMSADYIFEGASGVSGHTYEPYLMWNPRPDLIFPAYFSGRNLAESYYVGLPALSWQNVVVGDPLCQLK